MRKFTFSLLLSLSLFDLLAQNKLNDINRIVLNTYVPEQIETFPAQAKSLLENKLSQIATNYGIGGGAINPRFVLMANIAVLSKRRHDAGRRLSAAACRKGKLAGKETKRDK